MLIYQLLYVITGHAVTFVANQPFYVYFSLLFFFLKSSNTFGFVTRLYNIYYLLILFYFFVIFSSILFWIVISLGKQNKINDFFLKIKLQCWIILLSIHYIACVVSVFNSHSNTVEWLHRFKLFFAFFVEYTLNVLIL